MSKEQHLDYAFQLLDDFYHYIDKIPLHEKIKINDYGTASIEIDNKIKDLTLDAKKTVVLAKNLYKQIEKSKRQAVTNNFLKFFRLISENSKKVSLAMSKMLSDTTWIEKIPVSIIKKGIQAIEFFRTSINEVISELNDKIFINSDKISLIPKFNWKFVKADQNDREKKQHQIRMRDFESIYNQTKRQF